MGFGYFGPPSHFASIEVASQFASQMYVRTADEAEDSELREDRAVVFTYRTSRFSAQICRCNRHGSRFEALLIPRSPSERYTTFPKPLTY
jgi:hypothetical protein